MENAKGPRLEHLVTQGPFSLAAEYNRTNNLLSRLAQRGCAAAHPRFFAECVQDLALYYDVRYVVIGLLADESGRAIRSLVLWDEGLSDQGIEYTLADTPCQTALDNRQCYLAEKASALYPRNRLLIELGVESYFGLPLPHTAGGDHGVIAVMGCSPMSMTEDQQSVLRVFASRIASELSWKRSVEGQDQSVLDRELCLANKDLGVAYSELNALYDVINHDLRGPLRTIRGFSDAVVHELDSPQQSKDLIRDYCQRIHNAGTRMDDQIEVISMLRNMATRQLSRTPLNLSMLADEVSKGIEESMRFHHRLRVEIEPELRVEGDRYLLKEMLYQLFVNAWKYTESVSDAHVRLYRDIQNDIPVYVIQDNGIGFDMRSAEKLFTLFHKLHHEAKSDGNGVGLAIAHRIVRRHNGAIWADAEPGKGARFFFTLPGKLDAERMAL